MSKIIVFLIDMAVFWNIW